MKALLIAEKPSVMRSINKIYNKMNFPDEIIFKALVGHVVGLKYPGDYNENWGGYWNLDVLPMIPDKFSYEVNPRTKDVFDNIKKELETGEYDYVINACDNGREGQLIFYSVYEHIGCKLPVKRFWTADLSDKGLEKAMNNLLDDSSPRLSALTKASKLRSYFDWLLGMNLSRAASLKANATIPIGRVMTPTLAIVVNRENEIDNFVSQDFYELEADFGDYKGLWFDEKSNGRRFRKKGTAEQLKKQIIKDKNGKVLSVEKKKQKRNPFSLFSLAGLQKEANMTYGYSATKTLDIAQKLYQDRKLITYPRTDSEHLPTNVAQEIPNVLKILVDVPVYGNYIKNILKDKKNIEKTLKNKRFVNDSKVSDHFAIIPTEVKPNLSQLSSDEKDIYNLIVRRITSMFLPPQVMEKTKVVTLVGNNHFITNGSILIDDGFMVLYNKNNNDAIIPPLKKDQSVSVKDVDVLIGKTTPPQRYTEAKLIELMENVGRIIEDEDLKLKGLRIGTAATTGDVIDKLVERKFIERKGGGKTKSFFALPFGIDVIKMLDGQDIVSPELTAVWEKKLTDIEELKLDPKEFYDEMIEYTGDVVDKFKKDISIDLSKHDPKSKGKGKSKGNTREVIGKCPKCSSDVFLSKKYILCTGYKDKCDFIISRNLAKGSINKTNAKALMSGKETKQIDFVFKNGKSKAKLKLKPNGDLQFIFS